MNLTDLARRHVFKGFAIAPFTLLAAAMLLQHFAGHKPCPLCILQREGFLLAGLIAVAAAIHNPGRRGALAYLGAMLLPLLAGMGVAIRHAWALRHPALDCGADVVEEFVNGMFLAKLLPQFFYAGGDCVHRLEPVYGLPVPEWSLIWYVILVSAAFFFVFKWMSPPGKE
jgi:disulfide bond formation protein DsbB